MPAETLHTARVINAPKRLRAGRKMKGGRTALQVWPLDSSEPPPNTPFVATVPGSVVPLVGLDLPPGLRGAARETVGRRQVLEQLGLDPQKVDLRPAPLDGAGALWQSMLMASPPDLDRWRAQAARLGRNLRAILPDYLALPSAEGVWTIQTGAALDDPVQIRLGPQDGLSAEADLAVLTLERMALDPDRLPRAILRVGPALPVLDDALDSLSVQHPDVALVHRTEDIPSELAHPVRFAHGELSLDLAILRPDARAALRERLKGLLLPAAIFVLAGLIWTASHVLEVHRLEHQAQVAQEKVISRVRRNFLPEGPLPDIQLQVLRLLQERRADLDEASSAAGRPLTRMRQASSVLAEADIRLNAMRLQPDSAILLDVTSQDFTILDNLVADLRAVGLDVAPLRSASDGDGDVSGTMTILPTSTEDAR